MARHPLVLIVDYDPKNLRALSDLFRSHGYTVESASDGVVAVASFKKNKPDMVLLEAMIPKKHGFEVCQEIKKLPEGKSTPIIIMTGVYKGRKYRSQAMHVHGCDEYIEKPFAPQAILELASRFVPVPAGAAQEAVGEESEQLGEVIPFPAARSAPSAPMMIGGGGDDDDDDAMREIMSRLDEIMPDTSMFGSGARGSGVAALASASRSPAVDLRPGPDEGSEASGEEAYEIVVDDETPSAPAEVAAVSAQPVPSAVPSSPPSAPSPSPAPSPAPAPAKERAASSKKSRRGEKNAAGDRSSAKNLEVVPPAKSKSSVIPILIIGVVIVGAAAALYFISQM